MLFTVYAGLLLLLTRFRKHPEKFTAYTSSILSIIFTGVSFISLLSFLTPPINVLLYGLPDNHRCPFEILKPPYYLGYFYYPLLLGGVISGMIIGVFEVIKNEDTRELIEKIQVKLAFYSMTSITAFIIISSIFMVIYFLFTY